MELIKNNYLYGTGNGTTWHVNIDPPTRKVKTYFEETLEAVKYVYENKTGKFQVLFSGGLDSQYVCEVLLYLGMEFEIIIIELKNNKNEILNMHDIKYAYEFCNFKNITPTIYDLNFEQFIDTDKNIQIAESVQCCSIAIPATMYVAEKMDGFTLLGNDPPYIKYVPEKNYWALQELEYIHSLLRYYEKFNLNGCPFLLSYTSEMMLSFLIDPTIMKLGMGMILGKTGSNSSKSYVFNNGSGFNMPGYDFVTKSRIKYTGYEEIYQSNLMNHPNLQIFKQYREKWNGEYLENFSDVINRLSINQ